MFVLYSLSVLLTVQVILCSIKTLREMLQKGKEEKAKWAIAKELQRMKTGVVSMGGGGAKVAPAPPKGSAPSPSAA